MTQLITTPKRRLRVFVSSTLSELAPERDAVKAAVGAMRLSSIVFEAGARPHPPADLYWSYLEQSDVFVGIYWQSYGRIAPGEEISGLEDEYLRSSALPRLVYVKSPAPGREDRLSQLLGTIQADGTASYRQFSTPEELVELLRDDLAVLVTERFQSRPNHRHQVDSTTLTFLFADLADSTPLLHRLGEEYADLLQRYHKIVNGATDSHGGRVEVTEGDGFFCVFPEPVEAVAAAHEIQTCIAAESWPQSTSPLCRIGIHTGRATRTPEGLIGLDIHRAARIGAAAQGGQVLLSSGTRSLVEDHTEQCGWHLADLGSFVLKGISRGERISRLDFPELSIVLVPPRAQPEIPSTVPVPGRPIVGRIADVQGAAQMLLRDATRLVTITGPGGTGKTRLAVELANRLAPEFPDGVVFVDLAAVRVPEQFLAVVGRAFGVHEATGRTVVDGLRTVVGATRMLVILDNMEQLLAAGTELVQILEALPNVRVLVTSRSPLRLSWENEYPLSPLPVPPPRAEPESIRQSDAVTLLVQRAQAVRPGFALTPNNEAVVAEITRKLDGLPLAIELAAARLRLFTPDVLLQHLDDRLTLLDRGNVDAPERHRTLRAAIQWSHELLSDAEIVMFRRLGVFSGGWPLEAVLEVCVDENLSETGALNLLEELVAKSLVVFAIDHRGQARYRMLETLREFSIEKLQESGEEDEVRRRHLYWCLSLASRMEDALPTPEFPGFLEELDRERYNLREALAWCLRAGEETERALWMCGLLPLYWDTRGYVTEGLHWTEQLLARSDGTSPGQALALGAVGWLAMLAGSPKRSEEALSSADEMWRTLGDQKWLARSLAMHGMTTYNLNEIDQAESQFNEAIALAQAVGFEWIVDGWCVYGLAHVALARNDLMKADQLLRAALDYSKSRGLTWGVGHAQLSLGVLAFMMGDIGQAISRMSESLLVREQLRDARGICDCLGMMALFASVQGDHALAATLLGAAEVRREATGHTAVPWQQPLLAEAASSARDALAEEYEAGIAEGRALSLEQAIHFAIERLGTVASTSVSP